MSRGNCTEKLTTSLEQWWRKYLINFMQKVIVAGESSRKLWVNAAVTIYISRVINRCICYLRLPYQNRTDTDKWLK